MKARDLMPWRRDRSERGERRELAPQRRGTDLTRALQSDINRAFDEFWRSFDLPAPFRGDLDLLGGNEPRIDVRQNDKEIDIEAELPGMDEGDIDVEVAEGALVIRGDKEAEHEERDQGYVRRERVFGHIERVVPLPEGLDVDHAKATFKNGVLTVAIPRTAEAQAAAKHIDVKRA